MHKTRYNAMRLSYSLSPAGPLLVKAGGYSADPSLPDMQFVRTYRAGGEETLYIPGSSLKGVVRGFVEKALRTLNDRSPVSWRWACPTFPDDNDSCAKRLEKQTDTARVYANSCGACRLFGHTRLRGRAAFTDLMPQGDIKTEIRYGVAISRLTHAVAQGPFEMEVAVAGTFEGQLVMENYELWQVGVLATALEAMNDGWLKVGFGKNRGFGQVHITVTEATIEEVGHLPSDTTLRGLANIVTAEELQHYGLTETLALHELPPPQHSDVCGFYTIRHYDAEGWRAIARQAVQALA